MDRLKRPPPVPKFEDKNDKAQLEKKLNSFMSSIASTTPSQSKPQPQKADVAKAELKEEAGKKKITLANLNSKLNNMLSAKKININAAITSQVEKEKREDQRKIVQIEYDPQHPNSFQLTKHLYASQLATLTHSDSEEEVQENPAEVQMRDEAEGQCQPEEREQIALRMMQKFGFKVGEGLGKQSQGIRTPLIVRKTTDSSGVIEQSNIPLNFLISPETSAKNALAAHGVQGSEVIVLVGLLSLQQLQEGLEEEIRQECCLYGVVCDWVMYLFAGELRIFVEFQSKEQSLHAFVKMNGKYFGERLVSVRFYPLPQFRSRIYSETLHSHIIT